ncbi:MAG: ATP-dependent Clp protease adaptor protein ClpS [Gemmatimonadetes bacterium]|nr:ATP-dependent Clp protease adaptor protein ClpS [Gemmatimonadota bacterium]
MTTTPSRPDRQEDADVRERSTTRTPRRWRVLLHNDDFTPMEYVVSVLMRHFGRSVTEATRIMLEVHHAGLGVAGAFTRDVAETLVQAVTAEAQAEGFPLLLTAEPE